MNQALHPAHIKQETGMSDAVQGVAGRGDPHALCPQHASMALQSLAAMATVQQAEIAQVGQHDAGTPWLRKTCAWIIHHQLRPAHFDKSACHEQAGLGLLKP